jgi:hypothetical protein
VVEADLEVEVEVEVEVDLKVDVEPESEPEPESESESEVEVEAEAEVDVVGDVDVLFVFTEVENDLGEVDMSEGWDFPEDVGLDVAVLDSVSSGTSCADVSGFKAGSPCASKKVKAPELPKSLPFESSMTARGQPTAVVHWAPSAVEKYFA